MDFFTTLELLLNGFEKNKVRYGLIGGFALGILGNPRATVDLDFLVHRDDLEHVKRIMTSLGYECGYNSENVSQFFSPLKLLGTVDFIHAFRKPSIGMLERSGEMDIFEGKLKINVLKTEDIIGLKLQAAVNDPVRTSQENSDMEFLMKEYGKGLNWKLIEEYYSVFKQREKFLELKTKYGVS